VQHALGEAAHYNTLPAEFKGQYFTVQQRELTPVCVVQPESAEQVSQIVNILKEQECSFTIRSGGHGNHAGTSSIHNGLVVDLSKLNSVEISDDESTAFMGLEIDGAMSIRSWKSEVFSLSAVALER
jgi:FAD/FMN-containing dehydrogenase